MVRTRKSVTKSHSIEWLFCVLLALLLSGCSDDRVPIRLAGASMGTTWHVTYMPERGTPVAESVHNEVQAQLDAIDIALSTYREDSELSRFNAAPTGEWVALSDLFSTVLDVAMQVGESSGGAFDVTVGPLVNLWGFGPGQPVDTPPEAAAIATILTRVGQSGLAFDDAGKRLRKDKPVELDFSSLAKGFAVDRVAQALAALDIAHFLVEVGGEMKVSGESPRGDAWRIAIEEPDSTTRSVAAAIELEDTAVATSGDYRNYFEVDGVRYSHSIDARTGYPVAHDLVSVTVLHRSAMWADAWATALLVLGSEQAQVLAKSRGLAVYFIRRDGDAFAHSHTAAFAPYLETTSPDTGAGVSPEPPTQEQ